MIGEYALGLYFLMLIISGLTTYLFWISERFKSNFMVRATLYLLASLTLNIIGIFLMRFATIFNITGVHLLRNYILLTPRTLMFFALLNFLKQTVQKKK